MGPPESPVKLHDLWDRAPKMADLSVTDRAGCDPAPVDVMTAAGALWLQSFVWPDQTARFDRLNGAIEVAGRLPARIERTDDTVAWLSRELADPPRCTTTIVYHSIVWQYIDKPERERIAKLLADSGRRATPAAPFVWLQFEPDHLNRGLVSITLRAVAGRHARAARLGRLPRPMDPLRHIRVTVERRGCGDAIPPRSDIVGTRCSRS